MKYWNSPFAAGPSRVPDMLCGVSGYGSSLRMPTPPRDLIGDDVAVMALINRNQNLPLPLTFSPLDNLMRRKMSFPSVPVGFRAYPSNVRSLGSGVGVSIVHGLNQLSPMGAFADDTSANVDPINIDVSNPISTSEFTPTTQSQFSTDYGVNYGTTSDNSGSGSNFGTSLLNALPGLISAGTGVYNAANPAKPLNINYNPQTGQPMQSSSMSSMLPILLLGGAALVVFMMMSKKK